MVCEPRTGVTLRRELGLRDLVLFNIAAVVGIRWLAAAAHAGPGSLSLWVLAAAFFLHGPPDMTPQPPGAVLIIEDHDDTRELLQQVLEDVRAALACAAAQADHTVVLAA